MMGGRLGIYPQEIFLAFYANQNIIYDQSFFSPSKALKRSVKASLLYLVYIHIHMYTYIYTYIYIYVSRKDNQVIFFA